MTQTDDARGPERIWAFDYDLQDETGEWKTWQTWTENLPFPFQATEYIRADLAAQPGGAVKVKPLTEEDRAEITEAAYQAHRKHHRSGAAGQLVTEWDGIESWVVQATEARIMSALEPTQPDPLDDPRVTALGPIAEILADAVVAAEKAMLKFPQPNYVISKWAEETGEVTKALIHTAEGRETWANVRGEIVQSLAMLHRLMVEGDQVHGLPPLTALAAFDTTTGGKADE